MIFSSISSLFIEHHNRWCYNFCLKHQIYFKNLWEEGYSTIFIPVFNPLQFYFSGLLRYKWQIKLLQYLDGMLWWFDINIHYERIPTSATSHFFLLFWKGNLNYTLLANFNYMIVLSNIVIFFYIQFNSVRISSVAQSCPTLCDPMNRSMPGLPVHHQLLEFSQTHVHWVGDAIQPSPPLSSPSPAFNLSQHQGLFRWVSSLHQVAKILEFQLQYQSFQWTPRTDFL